MKYLVTSNEMKRYDNNTIEKIGIPGMVLMERAALSVMEHVKGHGKTVMVLAGVGNNGGDGLALARLLAEQGFEVDVWCVGDEAKASSQWKQQREILRNFPVTVSSKAPTKEYTILVDALFGVGLSREVTGVYAEAVERFNHMNGYKLALDVPSGLDADTGRVLGCAVRVDKTVTFGFGKRGLVMYPGCEYAGEMVTTDIGISENSFFGEPPAMFYYDEPVKELLPKRVAYGNKGSFGKVLLVAGSLNMAGAAVLAARAAYRAGAGMVKLITPKENRVIVQAALPEALLGSLEDLEESMYWADVIAIGPGIGQNEEAFRCLKTILEKGSHPLLVDADGLNLLAGSKELNELLQNYENDVILTPHVGELSRLTGESIATLKEDLSTWAMRLAKQLKAIVVAKDARTFVCEESKSICVNIRGNSGMATAGSGDVLAGVLAGLWAQGMDAYDAACVGVYVHAVAGECAAETIGEHGLMAGDIIQKLGCVNGEAGIDL